MAATNKCLARSNKSRRVIRATKDMNGHWESERLTKRDWDVANHSPARSCTARYTRAFREARRMAEQER